MVQRDGEDAERSDCAQARHDRLRIRSRRHVDRFHEPRLIHEREGEQPKYRGAVEPVQHDEDA